MGALSSTVPAAGASAGSAILLLRMYATTVTQQPAFPSLNGPGLDQLNTHLTAAQANANAWLNTYSAELEGELQSLVLFGKTFANAYESMSTAAQKMAGENTFQPNEISSLIGKLQGLKTMVQGCLASSQNAYGDLASYSTDVSSDRAAFLADYDAATAALSGIAPEVAALQAKIVSEQAALQKDNAMSVGGGMMSLAGMLMFAVGALLEFETMGVSTGLMIGGAALLAGGTAVAVIGGDGGTATLTALQSDQQALAAAKAEFTPLMQLKGQIEALTDTLGDAASALSGLVSGWQEIGNSLNALVGDLQRPDDYLAKLQQTDPTADPAMVAGIFSTELDVANQEWAAAVALVQSYQAKASNVQCVQTGASLPTPQAILAAAAAAGIPAAQSRISLAA